MNLNHEVELSADDNLTIKTPQGVIVVNPSSVRVFLTANVRLRVLDIVADGQHLNVAGFR